MSELSFCIVVASMNYREMTVFGDLESRYGDIGGEGSLELFAQRLFVLC